MNSLERVSTIMDDYNYYNENKHFDTRLLHVIIKLNFERKLDGRLYILGLCNEKDIALIDMSSTSLSINAVSNNTQIHHSNIDNFIQDVKDRLTHEY